MESRADGHVLLRVAIERGARNPDEDQHDAEVHDISAVAARVAHREFSYRPDERVSGSRADYPRAAVELHTDGHRHEHAQDHADESKNVLASERPGTRPCEQPHTQRPAEAP